MSNIKLVWATDIKKIILTARNSTQAIYKILEYCDEEEKGLNERIQNKEI